MLRLAHGVHRILGMDNDERHEDEAPLTYCPNCGGTDWFELSEDGDTVEVCVECGLRVTP